MKALAFVAVGMTCWTLVNESTEIPVHQDPFERLTATDASPVDRAKAAEQLSREGADAVPKLMQALGHADPLVRRSACYAIGRIGGEAADAEPLLYERLSDTEPLVRSSALRALTPMGRNPSQLASHAVLMFSDDNAKVRSDARRAVVQLGRHALPHVYEASSNRNANARQCVALVLLEMRPRSSQSITVVRRLLRDEDVNVRTFAFRALTSARAVDHADLLYALNDQNRVLLQSALQQPHMVFHPADGELVTRLAKLLEHPSADIRLLAALRLRIAGATARTAIPALIRLQDQTEGLSKATVAETLAVIGAPRDTYMPVLVKLLADTCDEDSPWYSASVLTRYASQDVPALIPGIERNLKHDSYSVRRAAVSALMGFGAAGRDAVPSLVQSLDSDDFEIRKRATHALANMGKAGRQALPHLIERVVAAESENQLVKLDYSPDSADTPESDLLEEPLPLPTPIQLSRWQIIRLWKQSKSIDLFAAEVDALGRLGAGEPAALAAVIMAVSDSSPDVRAAAANAIKNINCRDERTAIALKRLIVDESQPVRDAAARAIGRLGLLAVMSDVTFADSGQRQRLFRIASRAGRSAVSMQRHDSTNRGLRRQTG